MDIFGTHLAQVVDALYLTDRKEIDAAVRILENTRIRKGTVWLAGNGGSAATAEHFANDLFKMAGIRAISLTGMTPLITAYGNDDGWDVMFSSVLERFENIERDAVFAITCGGNSKNILRMLEHTRCHHTIVLTGNDKKSKVSFMRPTVLIRAEHPDIRVQEDIHSIFCHAMARMLSGEKPNDS